MKTRECIEAAALLKAAKVTKMEDTDKMKVIKAMRALEKVAKEYEALAKEVQEKLKGEEHEAMTRRAEKFNEECAQKPYSELTAGQIKERNGLNAYFAGYNRRVEEALKEEYERDVTVEYEPLTEDAFVKLIASNDLTVAQMMALAILKNE